MPTAAGRAGRTTSRSSTGPARSPSTRRSGGACGRISPIRRSRSGSATASPTSPRPSRWRRSVTRSPRAVRGRYDEGEPLPDLPHRLLEENMWRAIRYGLSGELIDFERGEPVPARASARAAARLGRPGRRRDRRLARTCHPGANAAERQIARFEEGASLAGDLRRAGAGRASRSADAGLADELKQVDREDLASSCLYCGPRTSRLARLTASSSRRARPRGEDGDRRDRRPPPAPRGPARGGLRRDPVARLMTRTCGFLAETAGPCDT